MSVDAAAFVRDYLAREPRWTELTKQEREIAESVLIGAAQGAIPEVQRLKAQHDALLERVTVLEKALEGVREVNDDDWGFREARKDEHPRDEIRRLIGGALDA